LPKIKFAKLNINEQLIQIRQSLGGIAPEIFLGIFFCVFLIAELLLKRKCNEQKADFWLQNIALAGGIITLCMVCFQWDQDSAYRFKPMLYLDKQAVFFKILITLSWIFTLIHVRILKYKFPPEFNSILIVSVLGLNILTMSTHLLTIYLTLEMVSIGSYLLVAISPYKKAAEGGLKYLLFGAVSSAVMVYGMSLIYGLTGTLDITNEAMNLGLLNNSEVVITATLVLTLSGMLYKLSLVPFHVWTPDVYEAAPTPLVSFLSVAPKAAVIVVLIRMAAIFPAQYFLILGGIAVISITAGNMGALWQINARRLLAYSSISQAGYLLVGVVAYTRFGIESAVFYTAVYVLINMTAFFLIDLLQPQSETELKLFSGLGKKQLWIGGILTVVMIALAGLPPTAGFTSKLLIFSALWERYSTDGAQWMLWILVIGVLNSAIALVYYLRLPYLLFFKEEVKGDNPVNDRMLGKIIGGILVATVLILFFNPELLMQWIALL
jgi:NADH-quinone oxidoreductase subunit N